MFAFTNTSDSKRCAGMIFAEITVLSVEHMRQRSVIHYFFTSFHDYIPLKKRVLKRLGWGNAKCEWDFAGGVGQARRVRGARGGPAQDERADASRDLG